MAMTLNTKFFIGIPTINRADLLNQALDKYVEDFPDIDIYIVDNGKQNISLERHKNVLVWKSESNMGVAKSWNHILTSGFWSTNAEYGLILNDDIYLGKKKDYIKDLIFVMIKQGIDLLQSQNHMCSFIISKECYNYIGQFDEMFYPAYFEDNDYRYRMKLLGKNIVTTDRLNPKIFRNSQTIAKDPTLNQRFQTLRNYYISKWGGAPNEEKFQTPFNQ